MPEKDPLIRNRYTYYGRIAQLFPMSMTTLQLQYRYYTDDWQLDAPPALVAAPDTPVPFAPELEDAYLPSAERVRAAVEALLEY